MIAIRRQYWTCSFVKLRLLVRFGSGNTESVFILSVTVGKLTLLFCIGLGTVLVSMPGSTLDSDDGVFFEEVCDLLTSNSKTDESLPRYSQPLPKPRILKGDIRRSYSNMLANVINSGDFPALYGMFDCFFSPYIKQITLKHVENNVVRVTRQGIASVITFGTQLCTWSRMLLWA